jgi:tryptophan synthase alpha chain
MASRLESHIRSVSASGDKALGVFVTSGFPTPKDTLPILQAIDEGGADFIELGMPFSDPLAEGLPIQHSSQVALSKGITMGQTLATASSFRRQSETPLVLMGYANPIVRYGISNFFDDARSSGVDGVILPDVLPEADSPFLLAARAAGVDLISLIAPTTPEDRMALIDEMSSGFVYAVSVTGVTGTDLGSKTPILAYLKRASVVLKNNPLLVGFGIRSNADVIEMTEHTDGAIVGSALVAVIDALWGDESLSAAERIDGVRKFVYELKTGSKHA